MSISITINATSPEEARDHILKLLGTTIPTSAIQLNVPSTASPKALTAAEKKKAEKEAARQISDGGERTDPKDTAETDKQDTADEAADKGEAAKLSHDSIRTALGAYVKKFGMPAAQEDGPKVITLALGARDKADATVNWKISDIPDEQETLKKVLDGVSEMTAKNPFKREAVKA